jgi:hypothetical protein
MTKYVCPNDLNDLTKSKFTKDAFVCSECKKRGESGIFDIKDVLAPLVTKDDLCDIDFLDADIEDIMDELEKMMEEELSL